MYRMCLYNKRLPFGHNYACSFSCSIQWKPVIRTSSGVEKHVLITGMFLYPVCSYNRYVLITGMFL